jgi:hypothetical protein
MSEEAKKTTIYLERDSYDEYSIGGQIGSRHQVDKDLAERMIKSKHATVTKPEGFVEPKEAK